MFPPKGSRDVKQLYSNPARAVTWAAGVMVALVVISLVLASLPFEWRHGPDINLFVLWLESALGLISNILLAFLPPLLLMASFGPRGLLAGLAVVSCIILLGLPSLLAPTYVTLNWRLSELTMMAPMVVLTMTLAHRRLGLGGAVAIAVIAAFLAVLPGGGQWGAFCLLPAGLIIANWRGIPGRARPYLCGFVILAVLPWILGAAPAILDALHTHSVHDRLRQISDAVLFSDQGSTVPTLISTTSLILILGALAGLICGRRLCLVDLLLSTALVVSSLLPAVLVWYVDLQMLAKLLRITFLVDTVLLTANAIWLYRNWDRN